MLIMSAALAFCPRQLSYKSNVGASLDKDNILNAMF